MIIPKVFHANFLPTFSLTDRDQDCQKLDLIFFCAHRSSAPRTSFRICLISEIIIEDQADLKWSKHLPLHSFPVTLVTVLLCLDCFYCYFDSCGLKFCRVNCFWNKKFFTYQSQANCKIISIIIRNYTSRESRIDFFSSQQSTQQKHTVNLVKFSDHHQSTNLML